MAQAVIEDKTARGEQLRREGIVIRTYDLWKTYVMGDQEIHAVSGCDVEIRRKASTSPSWAPRDPANPR